MEPSQSPAAVSGLRHVFVRDLVLAASIGVHPHEHAAPQRVRINVDLGVEDEGARRYAFAGRPRRTRPRGGLREARRYASAPSSAPAMCGWSETLAERIAEACLRRRRVHLARVRVEKLDIFADAMSAGVEVERRRRDLSTP